MKGAATPRTAGGDLNFQNDYEDYRAPLVHELCVCVAGAMTVVVEDYSGVKEMRISKPTEAAYIAPDTWITLKVREPWHLS